MPTVTGPQLLAQVRSIADEPDDGAGAKAYCTDSEIYTWLSDHYRAAIRGMARGGYPYSLTREDFVTPGASCTLASDALAVAGVYVTRGTSTVPLPRLVQNRELYSVSGAQAMYWQPRITAAGAFSIGLYPNESTDTVRVYYLPEPVDIGLATSIHLPGSWKRVIVMGAALDAYTKRDKMNQVLVRNFTEAQMDAELEATQYAEQVVANTDDYYRPGDIVNKPYVDPRLDFGVYLVP